MKERFHQPKSKIPFLLALATLLLAYLGWYFYNQEKTPIADSVTIERIVVTPLEGRIWREGKTRAVVAFCPSKSKHRPAAWKQWVMVRVYFQHTSPDRQTLPFWYGGLIKTTDVKGNILPSACLSSGPSELDEQGKMIDQREEAPMTSTRHYVLEFELRVPK